MATLQSILSGISEQDDAEKTLEALSQAAEAAERYEDMVKIMETLVTRKLEKQDELSPDQRNLLSVAYKNVVGAKRSAWRVLNEDNQLDTAQELVTKYKKRVEGELEDTCTKILEVLEKLSGQNGDRMKNEEDEDKKKSLKECQVFYLKMIGDYYRYLTEAFPEDKYKSSCSKYYNEAMEIAEEALEATHPTRLGLALNFSVCYYEILNEPKQACDLAKKAFDEAIEKLDSLSDVSYRDSTLIMQLLRDNLTIWNQTDENPNQLPDDNE